MFIDAVIIKGAPYTTRTVSISVNENEDGRTFVPFDLSDYNVHFYVKGSATLDGKTLIEKVITGNSDAQTVGNIYDPANGQFSFTITKEDTELLGLGRFPIAITLHDADTDEYSFALTEGGLNGEFNSIQIVQV